MHRILTSSIHPLRLRHALFSIVEAANAPRGISTKNLRPLVREVAKSGFEWSRSFLGNEKLGFKIGEYDVDDDLDHMLDLMKASNLDRSYVKNTLPSQSPRAKYGHSPVIARTVSMNIYCKTSLIEYQEDGLTHVRRMAIHDDKVSNICRALNGTIHDIKRLLSFDFPLTHDSHLNCRCTFVPFFDAGGYKPIHRDIPTKLNFLKFENAPREFEPWLRGLNKHITFEKVIFKKDLPSTYKVEGRLLFLNPKDASDPREVILAQEAKKVYDAKKFKEIMSLIDSGEIKSDETLNTPLEHFIHFFVEYKLNQLTEPVLIKFFASIK